MRLLKKLALKGKGEVGEEISVEIKQC